MRLLQHLYMSEPLVLGSFTGYALTADKFKMEFDHELRLVRINDRYMVPLEQVLFFVFKDTNEPQPKETVIKEDKRSLRNTKLVSKQLPGSN